MTFKMNKPIMKGSVLHKKLKSAAQYKTAKEMSKLFPLGESRTSPDTGLVTAGGKLGESYIPHAIDYGIDTRIGDIEGVGVEEGKKVKPTEVIKIKPKQIKAKVGKGEGKPTKATFPEKKKEGEKKEGAFITIEDIRKSNEEARRTGIVKAVMTEIEKKKAKEKRKEEEKKVEPTKVIKVKQKPIKPIEKKTKKKKTKKKGDGTKFGRWLKKTFSKK